ncbi:MAG: group II intron reverse transcriptase/maturase [bacterium]
MCEKQQLQVPKNDKELRNLQDEFYKIAKEGFMKSELVGFKDLKEIAFCEANIITSIHKLKANKGSLCAGTDEEVLRADILEKGYEEVIERIQRAIQHYIPKSIKRVFIPKADTTELRPLGIPAIIDRIIQECIRNIIEPILEAQFFDHSYGFRPLRDGHQAYTRISKIMHNTGYHWVIEGDITKFFDNVNHNILLGALYHMGIQDIRILQMIKAMLKAGVMNETCYNDIGTPQGGIISPLLANVYLNKFDNFITREWEEKRLKNVSRYRKSGKSKGKKTCKIQETMKKKAPNMKPAFLIRYADDWVVITNSLENAKKLKRRISVFLKSRLKLKLSEKKTKITNAKKRGLKFLGFQIKARAGKSRSGLIINSKPDRDTFKRKVSDLRKSIHGFKKVRDINKLIHKINLHNAKVQGIVNYYRITTGIYHAVKKTGYDLAGLAIKILRTKVTAAFIPAKEVQNLIQIHKDYKKTIPSIRYKDLWIGVTDLRFVKWEAGRSKNPAETIYSSEGRELYRKRTSKRRGLARKDLTLSEIYSEYTSNIQKENSQLYNFEFFMNRGYVYNVDKGKCRLCGRELQEYEEIATHHIRPYLTAEAVNRVHNLATTHLKCHRIIHSLRDLSKELSKKVWNKVQSFRNKLKEH